MIGLSRGKVKTALELLYMGGFPWASAAAPGASPFEARFRRNGRHLMMKRWPRLLRPFAAAAMVVLWPVGSAQSAIGLARSVKPDSLAGGGRGRAAVAAWACALRHNVLPIEFFAYRLRDRPRASIDAWVYGDEYTRVFASLTGREAQALADDKHAFSGFCAGRGLASVPTLALYADGRAVEPFAAGRVPAHDLVIKPRKGARTEGIEPWFHDGGTYRQAPGGGTTTGMRRDAEGVGRRIAELSRQYGQVLVQPALRPHPALRAVTGTGVPTARMVTGATPQGDVSIIEAMIQRPADGEFVSQGYRYALVDPATGRVRGDSEGQRDPVFGSARLDPALAGLTVPDWQGCCDLVLRGHAAFPQPAGILGWDVGFTEAGPVLIETNVGLSFFQFQMASLAPALRGPLGALMEAWLR